MCVATDEEWIGGESGGYGDTGDYIVVEAPVVYVDPTAYAGVDWEEIHPPLIDSIEASLSTLGLQLPDFELTDLNDIL